MLHKGTIDQPTQVLEGWPVILKDKNLKWEEIKGRIIKETQIYLKQI